MIISDLPAVQFLTLFGFCGPLTDAQNPCVTVWATCTCPLLTNDSHAQCSQVLQLTANYSRHKKLFNCSILLGNLIRNAISLCQCTDWLWTCKQITLCYGAKGLMSNTPVMIFPAPTAGTDTASATTFFDVQKRRSKANFTQWTTVCPGKKRLKCFFVISSTKIGRFWWNLVHSFLNKFAAKLCKRFPSHLNNVSILPCETWNPHHAGASTALSDKEPPEFISSQLWPSNSL